MAFVVDFGDDATLVDVDGDVPVAKSDGSGRSVDCFQFAGHVDACSVRTARALREDAVDYGAVLGAVESGSFVVEGRRRVVVIRESMEAVVDVPFEEEDEVDAALLFF